MPGLHVVRNLVAAAIASELHEYPWESLDPAKARKIHASLPPFIPALPALKKPVASVRVTMRAVRLKQ
jgi:hypothetical protein